MIITMIVSYWRDDGDDTCIRFQNYSNATVECSDVNIIWGHWYDSRSPSCVHAVSYHTAFRESNLGRPAFLLPAVGCRVWSDGSRLGPDTL